ncbi:hypothetical protein AB6Q13_07630 [Ralstonia solanacearum]|uniref:hypothetical protein n=1 Tax=Ralstonia solanacearum TaxID=305 RepID=UPI002306A83E|nr:hypothetical protein [Ralstonia solanacearum]MDB0566921.1 hypothetical protein [Ralstonia solanacearum]MDB0576640.1 hypothetical protein [Ralstonia solanacearum]
MTHLSAIAFAVRQAAAPQGIALSTGHAQQLVAAALGHNNLASYQASGDDVRLPEAADIVLDSERLHARAATLGHNGHAFVQALTAVLRARFPDAELYDDHEAWLMVVQSHFELAIVNDDSVESEVAMTNGTSPQVDVDLPWWDTLGEYDGDDLSVEFESLVTVDQDEDRTYYGDEIDVHGTLTVERLGRRLFGSRSIDVEHAKLRWLGGSNESPN